MRSALAVVALQTPAEVEQALAFIYSRPEFEPARESLLWGWIIDALGAAWRFLRGLLPSIDVGEGGGGTVFWTVVGLLGVAAFSVLLRMVRRMARMRVRASLAGNRPPGGIDLTLNPASAEAWEERARSLAGAGHWREAAVALYQALLHRLAARGALRLHPSKTPGDYRRETRQDADSHQLLDRFLRGFEPVAFGGRAADAAVYERLRNAASAVSSDG